MFKLRRCDEETLQELLVANGLLGATPFSPSHAFTIDLLEHYRIQRSRLPNYGYEPFVRSQCDDQRVCKLFFSYLQSC